ncbi:hypothetical protein BsWGS_16609 [Bradybaena similaris]
MSSFAQTHPTLHRHIQHCTDTSSIAISNCDVCTVETYEGGIFLSTAHLKCLALVCGFTQQSIRGLASLVSKTIPLNYRFFGPGSSVRCTRFVKKKNIPTVDPAVGRNEYQGSPLKKNGSTSY